MAAREATLVNGSLFAGTNKDEHRRSAPDANGQLIEVRSGLTEVHGPT